MDLNRETAVSHAPEGAVTASGTVLLTLASAQFLMTLDSSVMNVAIATVAKDVGTTVTGIQTAITFYPPLGSRRCSRRPHRAAWSTSGSWRCSPVS